MPMVMADFVLLEQVIFNLVDNAAKYTPKGTDDPYRRTCRGWRRRKLGSDRR